MEKIKVRSLDGNSYWLGTLEDVKRWAMEKCYNDNTKRRQDAALRHFGAVLVTEPGVSLVSEEKVETEPVVVDVPVAETLTKPALLAAALLGKPVDMPQVPVAPKPDTSHRGYTMRTWRWKRGLSRGKFAQMMELSPQYIYLLENNVKHVTDKVWTRFEGVVEEDRAAKRAEV